MAKQVIQATSTGGGGQPLYLLGYQDDGETWECLWTSSRFHARWFDADEAEAEVQLLLTVFDSEHLISPQPIGA